MTGELCAIAAVNSPAAAGLPSSVVTMPPPADSPNKVTRSGSPPNAAMLSRTQVSAAKTSRRPRLVAKRPIVERREVEEPQRTQPIVHRHHDDVTAHSQLAPVVKRLAGGAEDVGATVHPHHHRLAVAGLVPDGAHTFSVRKSSPCGAPRSIGIFGSVGWGHTGPTAVASAGSDQRCGCSGALDEDKSAGNGRHDPRTVPAQAECVRGTRLPSYSASQIAAGQTL